ncbi:MAG TPA: glycoside hydrolase family 5 protein, partial [Candidatus Marinimicrobia bacterium]|nr:glycoside hydrolase family 5 protein [Candidatus Neomarinimicrobiota bacterium]
GRGVNILGYDPIWDSFEKARFKEHHFKLIREAGFNTVRINLHPFRHMDSTTFELREDWWKVLDWAVENALANDLMVILDMHEYYAMADDPVSRKDMWLAFWKQVAERYQDSSDDVLFELLNEPNGKLNSELWNDFLLEGLAVVRNSNPHRTVIIGPAQYNQINQLDSLILPEKDRNIIVTIHYYSPMDFTHQGASWAGRADLRDVRWLGTAEEKQAIMDDFAKAQNWSKKHNRPLFLGEFGVYDKADMESRTKYLSFVTRTVENLGWSWAYWQFDSDFILYDIDNEHWIEPVLKALIPKTTDVN